MRVLALSDDDADPTEPAEVDPNREPEYAITGYNVEFSQKIALTPPATKRREAPRR